MLKDLTPSQRDSIAYLCEEYKKYNYISSDDWAKYGVKRGLRNANGTGVLAGLTSICDVVGYEIEDGERVPIDGKLYYRGIDVAQIVESGQHDNRYLYEEVVWLLRFAADGAGDGNVPHPARRAAGSAYRLCGGHDHESALAQRHE